MSGICGIIAFDPAAPVNGIDAMTGAAPWRGPDGTGVWRGEGAVLAHQALHVTPESRHEEQPVVDEEAGLVLVADARIDNRDDLQRTLRRDLRRSVRSGVITDADLILAAYRRWGTDCVAHLLGDFAFAVWDRRKRQLFAARDPMAMRPFYYRIEAGRVLFGSEVKQILAAPGVSRAIFEPMVAMHLCGRFDRLDWTFYEGIAQLEPAHALAVTPGGAYRTWRYWDIDPAHQIRYTNEQDYVEHFRALFKEAVRCRLRSHKPVGLFLSGGLDSGSIASMAGHLKETEGLPCPEFRTYSWKFPTLTQCDERHISDLICARYDLPATYIDAEAVNLIGPPDGVPDADEPFNVRFKALIAAGVDAAHTDGVARLLTGQGGDLMVGLWIADYASLLREGHLWRLWRTLSDHRGYTGDRLWKILKNHIVLAYAPNSVFGKSLDCLRGIKRTLFSGHGEAQVDGREPIRRLGNFCSQRLPAQRKVGNVGMTRAVSERIAGILNPLQRRVSIWTDRLFHSRGCVHGDPWSDLRMATYIPSIPQYLVCQPYNNKHLIKEGMSEVVPHRVLKVASKVSPKPLYLRALKEHVLKREPCDVSFQGFWESQAALVLKLAANADMRENHDSLVWQALSLLSWQSAKIN